MAATTINLEQLDAAVIAYIEWHKHAQCVRIAYGAWTHAKSSERSGRHVTYLEELDREERACELYAEALFWNHGQRPDGHRPQSTGPWPGTGATS